MRATSGAERGFVLVAAMWLLLLGGSLAALLMLRSITSAREFVDDNRRHDARRLADDAVESIAADLIFRGQASAWGRLPASGTVDLDGRQVSATVRAEADFPDINTATPTALDTALAGQGATPDVRVAMLARIDDARARGRRFTALTEIAALGRGLVAPGREDCLATAFSALAGGGSGGGAMQAGVGIGSLTRLTVGDGAARQIFVLRLITANDRPYALMDAFSADCAGSVALGAAA